MIEIPLEDVLVGLGIVALFILRYALPIKSEDEGIVEEDKDVGK